MPVCESLGCVAWFCLLMSEATESLSALLCSTLLCSTVLCFVIQQAAVPTDLPLVLSHGEDLAFLLLLVATNNSNNIYCTMPLYGQRRESNVQ
jgi:hypothetical protein